LNDIEQVSLASARNRADALAQKMNKLTDTLMSNIQTAEELHITGTEVIESVEEKTEDVDLYSSDMNPLELLNLENLLEDFKYIRDSLRETSDNARKILSQTACQIQEGSGDLGDEPSDPVELINSYAILNKALTDNMKMYVQAYKEISNIILNIDKVKNSNAVKNVEQSQGSQINNTQINVYNSDDQHQAINTRDILRSLQAEKDK
jgi:hypothetical protein